MDRLSPGTDYNPRHKPWITDSIFPKLHCGWRALSRLHFFNTFFTLSCSLRIFSIQSRASVCLSCLVHYSKPCVCLSIYLAWFINTCIRVYYYYQHASSLYLSLNVFHLILSFLSLSLLCRSIIPSVSLLAFYLLFGVHQCQDFTHIGFSLVQGTSRLSKWILSHGRCKKQTSLQRKQMS